MTWIKSGRVYEPYVPPSWNKGTDTEIVKALQKHYAGQIDLKEYWAVGDERTVSLSAMSAINVSEYHYPQDVVFVLSNIGGKYLADGITECVFQVDQKNSLNEIGYMNSTQTNVGGWKNSLRRAWCNEIYKNALPSTMSGIFKEFINQSGTGNASTSGVEDTIDTFALRAEIEVLGETLYSVSGEGSQVKWYETASNRIKQVNSSNNPWWERSPRKSMGNYFCDITSSGVANSDASNNNLGIAPFGVI